MTALAQRRYNTSEKGLARKRAYRATDAYKQSHEAHRRRKMAAIDAIKLERGCADCGYREKAIALAFDHLPQYEKLRAVAAMVTRSMESILAEIEKCEVVCHNCHAIRTQERRG